MIFHKIDMENWNRKESYHHYLKVVPCTYSMTVNLDITKLMDVLKKKNIKFFSVLLYALAHTVNKYAEFRMDLDELQNLGYYSYVNPSYTVFHSETETFNQIWTEYDANFKIFSESYRKDMLKYKNDFLHSKPFVGKNYFNVSCIPWINFTGFNLNLPQGYNYFLPIFTLGKYYCEDKKILLPLAVQVHHAVCDGFHLARFINDLQVFLDMFAKEI